MDLPKRLYLADQTADVIRNRILAGEYPEKLPGERILASSLKVSRNVVREALQILGKSGFLSAGPPGGARRISTHMRVPAEERKRRVAFLSGETLDEAESGTLRVFEGLRKYGNERGWECSFHQVGLLPANRLKRHMEDLVASRACDLWVGCALSSTACFDWLHEAGHAVIGYNFTSPKPYGVIASDYESARIHGINTLFRAGRRNIVKPVVRFRHEIEARPIRELFKSRGLEFSEDFHLPVYDGTQKGFCELMERLFAADKKPDGIILDLNVDVQVVTLQGWLMSQGLSYPRDVSVLSLGMPSYHKLMVPAVSCYAEREAINERALFKAIRDYFETGKLLNTRKSTLMELIPGGSI